MTAAANHQGKHTMHAFRHLAPLLLCACLSPDAAAAEFQTSAAGACKSALPVFDGNIRTRPLALQNEGSANAFVSCAQQSEYRFNANVRQTAIRLLNNTNVSVSITCTHVDGFAEGTTNAYQTTTVSVPANSSLFLAFRPVSPAMVFNTPFQSFSCNLPPSTGIARVALVNND